ncbi:MAG: hypothetical protein ACO3HV_12065 [Candidatus Nanopelagicales bacterium]
MPILDWTVIAISKPVSHIAWTHSLRDGAHLIVNQSAAGHYSWELMTRDPITDQRGRASSLEDAQRQAEGAAVQMGLVDVNSAYTRDEPTENMDRAQVASLIDVAMRGER